MFKKKCLSILLSGILSVCAVLPFKLIDVFAFGSNWESSGQYKSIGSLEGRYYNSSQSRTNFTSWTLSSSTSASDMVNDGGVLFYKGNDGSAYQMLVYSPVSGYYLIKGWSTNGVNYSFSNFQVNSSKVTTDNQGINHTIYFSTSNSYYSPGGSNTFSNTSDYITLRSIFGNVPFINSSSMNTADLKNAILDVINTDSTYYPWDYSDSSGGLHWSDGVSLDNDNRTLYNNVYTVMDVNNDNSITEQEVNFYNVTYNTNYDYDAINSGNDFDLNAFLYYVALKLTEGEDPTGGSGGSDDGGGSGTGGGSMSQTQTQSIEENAVNVTVNNGSGLTPEEINSIINGDTSTATPFNDAIQNIRGFSTIATEFSGFVSSVFAFLPSWALALLAMVFSILGVMIVLRLIHLFI